MDCFGIIKKHFESGPGCCPGRIWGVAMIIRMFFVGMLLWALSPLNVVAEDVFVPLLTGEVFVDGRPIDKVVEVRLEAHNQALVASAYTFESARFTFRGIMLALEDTYYLVINESGFRELRYELRVFDFIRDSASSRIRHFAGLLVLNLERLPPEKKANDGRIIGPKAVDARQLKAEISDEARREYNLALQEAAAGDARAALTRLEKAVKLAPEYYDALNKLGAAYLRAGEYRKAEAILDRARALNPNDPLPLTNLGILHFEEGGKPASATAAGADGGLAAAEASYRKAVEFFDKALRLDSLAPRTNFYLGTALYKIGSYERAESLLLNTLALDKTMHEAHLTLLNIYTRQQRYDAALEQIAAYLEAIPDSPKRQQLEALRIQIESSRSK
jgi:tetratricopeptide (TPR) repeat protein